jgi:hypothetical protein
VTSSCRKKRRNRFSSNAMLIEVIKQILIADS